VYQEKVKDLEAERNSYQQFFTGPRKSSPPDSPKTSSKDKSPSKSQINNFSGVNNVFNG